MWQSYTNRHVPLPVYECVLTRFFHAVTSPVRYSVTAAAIVAMSALHRPVRRLRAATYPIPPSPLPPFPHSPPQRLTVRPWLSISST